MFGLQCPGGFVVACVLQDGKPSTSDGPSGPGSKHHRGRVSGIELSVYACLIGGALSWTVCACAVLPDIVGASAATHMTTATHPLIPGAIERLSRAAAGLPAERVVDGTSDGAL